MQFLLNTFSRTVTLEKGHGWYLLHQSHTYSHKWYPLHQSQMVSPTSVTYIQSQLKLESHTPTWLRSIVAPCPAYMGTSSAVRRARDRAIIPTSACVWKRIVCAQAVGCKRIVCAQGLCVEAYCVCSRAVCGSVLCVLKGCN
jgi:hypothetical protein